MAGKFLLRRSRTAREQAQHGAQVSLDNLTRLIALVTALADRMDALPSMGLDRDRQRRERVLLLRHMATAGRQRLSAHAQDASGDQATRAVRRP
jgi:hypothetical protein